MQTLSVDRIGYLVPAADFDGARAQRLCAGVQHRVRRLAADAGGPRTWPTARRRCGSRRGAAPTCASSSVPASACAAGTGSRCARGVALRLAGAADLAPCPAARASLPLRESTRQPAARGRRAGTPPPHAFERHRSRRRRRCSPGSREACRAPRRRTGRAARRAPGRLGRRPDAGRRRLSGRLAARRSTRSRASRADRARFLRELSAAILARTRRTTPIAAHYLRLAAQGHFNADVIAPARRAARASAMPRSSHARSTPRSTSARRRAPTR